MKSYLIYFFDTDIQGPDKDSGPTAIIEKAKNEIEALKLWHLHLNGTRSAFNFLRNSTFEAVQRIKL